MNLSRIAIAATLLLLALNVHAKKGTNPLSWAKSGNIPASTQQNQSYSVNFAITNNLPFTMPTPVYISNNSKPLNETVMTDNCSGKKLTRNQTCNVGLVLTPKSAGTKKLQVYMEYGSNKVPVPDVAITTTTAANAGSSGPLSGVVSSAFPSAITSNTTYTLSFTFTNNTSSALTGLSLSQDAGNTTGYTQSTSSCIASLAANTSCVVTGSFSTADTSGAVTVGYTYANSSLSANAVTSTIINNETTLKSRTIHFVNNCTQDVWFGFVGGAVNTNPCTSDSQCDPGSYCNSSANSGAGECFYGNPTPPGNDYKLTASTGNRTVTINDYNLQYVWSGNIAARTGATCGTGACDTADCGSTTGDKACPVGDGFSQPATLSEFTMQRGTVDSYDISIINGMNVGAEITPTTSGTFTSNGIAAYNCQSPGNPATVPSLGLGACNWASGFTPPAYPNSDSASSYKYVKPPGSSPTTCTDDSPCTTPPYSTCGLSFNKTGNVLSKVCGQFLGYISADQACSFANTNLSSPNSGNNPGDPYFNCDTALGSPMSVYTFWGLYACKAQANGDLNTCYNTSANPPASTTNCCGCVDWQNVVGVTVPSTTTTCVNFNTLWTSLSTGVYPGIKWLKEACPTAYSYPYDDKSSGFSCMDINASNTTNTVDYTITFCPT